MAGPSVVVRVLGDLSSFSKSLTSAGSTGQSAFSRMHAGFSTMVNTINQTGILGPFAGQLSAINDAIGSLGEHAKSVSGVMLGVGGVMTGVGSALSAFGSKEKAAHQQLQAAIAATGHSYEQYGKQIEGAIHHEENYGHSSEQTQQALQALTMATHDPGKALQLLGETTDLAAAQHEDLASAASAVGKVFNGNTKLLKQYGITLDKHTHLTKDGQTATQALAVVLKGQASAAANTFSGHLDAIKTKIEDQISMFGSKYGPAIQGIGIAFMALASVMEVGSAIIQAAEWGAFWPILLIVAAIALIGVAAYEMYKHWKEIWGFIKKIIFDVWDWIKNNWPYLLGVLLGPIALAAAIIYKHWRAIMAGAKMVIDYIVAIWNDLVTFFTGIPARLYAAASGAWNFLYSEAQTVYGWVAGVWSAMINWVAGIPGDIARALSGLWNFISAQANAVYGSVQGIWNGMIRWISGLPGAIARVAGGMWNGIYNAFRGMINGIIDLWNMLHFQTPSFKLPFPPHTSFPSVSIGAPHIPHLAQGGLMTGSGLVFAHAGEVITPAPEAARRGPVVNVEHATFATEMDVESFMKRVAWVAATRGL
jgi:phage-related protein